MPENDPEQELGPKITAALQNQADAQTELQKTGLAREARRRVRKRRQTLSVAAAAVVVAVAIGGVWNLATGESPVASNASDSGSQAAPESAASGRATNGSGLVPPKVATGTACPADHPILTAPGPTAVPAGTGLDLNTKVTGMHACRYGPAGLLGQESFSADVAQQVVDEIKVLPERNPDLPVFKCTPQAAQPSEAIVLRFDTADGVREIWVQYDGCDAAGFFTGTHTYGLYAAPLKLFMTGKVRPPGGTYLNALKGW